MTDYYLTHTTWQIRAADGTLLERPSKESRKNHSVLSYRGQDHASSLVAVAVRKADTSWNRTTVHTSTWHACSRQPSMLCRLAVVITPRAGAVGADLGL